MKIFNLLMPLLSLSLCMSCANPHTSNTLAVDPAFQPYVLRFEAQSALVGAPVTVNNLIIKFANDVVRPQVAFCASGNDTVPEIHVDAAYWNSCNDTMREQLLFHEMGHCVLFLQHTSVIEATTNGKALPESIMNPYLFNNGVYMVNHAEYIKQLFDSSYVPNLQ